MIKLKHIVSAATFAVVVPYSASAGTAEALDSVDALFDGYYAWFGSMYDRQTGGVYYSSASRSRPDTYTPHIEPTSKYTRVIDWSGLADKTPAIVKTGIVSFIRSKQIGDPTHAWYGFFLDKNYRDLNPVNNGETVSDYRVGRALGFSMEILDLFQASPDYPFPTADQNKSAFSHLQTASAFRNWLENQNWNRMWGVGGNILAQADNIKLLDADRKREILNTAWDYLENVRQDPSSGYWGNLDQGNNTNPYVLLCGAHKIVAFYQAFNRPVPHADNLMDSALREVETQPAPNLLCTYNASYLVKNLRMGSNASITPEQLERFIIKEAGNMALFRQKDGGFSTTRGARDATLFQPATRSAVSNTDVGGLALKTRDALHDLANGFHAPLAASSDPRFFGMSGENSRMLARYSFTGKSRAPETPDNISATDLTRIETDSPTGADGDGFRSETGSAGDLEIGHRGLNGANSFYEFSVDAVDASVSFYFLALSTRTGTSNPGDDEGISISFALGENPDDSDFIHAGETSVRGKGYVSMDIPLLTFDALQHVGKRATFRIYGNNCSREDQTFLIDTLELHGLLH